VKDVPTGERRDPYLNFNFAVEIDGLVAGGFSEVTGLQGEVEVEEYREGGRNGFTHKRAGATKYPANIVLKRGVTDKRALWDWWRKGAAGRIERKNISIIVLDHSGQERVRWTFEQAYPVKWSGPDLRGSGNEVAAEAIELVHCGLAKE
jgi:phage tail-like protein